MLQPQYDIHALHGFLGHPSDWLCLQERVFAYSLFQDFPIIPFDAWAENFNFSVEEKSNIFIGYSLGGRLGLHALLQNPAKWKAAIFVSTHPGLNDQAAKRTRLAMDEAWAERFLNEPWDSLLKRWNQQDVFKHSVEINRSEVDNNRQDLAAALKIWSLGMQEDLTDKIKDLEMPICWMVGEKDHKFVDLAAPLQFKHPKSKLFVVPQAGHRLNFDQPEKFKTIVTQFIQNLEPIS